MLTATLKSSDRSVSGFGSSRRRSNHNVCKRIEASCKWSACVRLNTSSMVAVNSHRYAHGDDLSLQKQTQWMTFGARRRMVVDGRNPSYGHCFRTRSHWYMQVSEPSSATLWAFEFFFGNKILAFYTVPYFEQKPRFILDCFTHLFGLIFVVIRKSMVSFQCGQGRNQISPTDAHGQVRGLFCRFWHTYLARLLNSICYPCNWPQSAPHVNLSCLLRVINFKFPLQPHQKHHITLYEELGFS